MVAFPPEIPVTVPVDEPIVAMAILLLDHVAAAVTSLNVIEAPWQTGVLPVITAGSELTVTGMVAMQLLLIV